MKWVILAGGALVLYYAYDRGSTLWLNNCAANRFTNFSPELCHAKMQNETTFLDLVLIGFNAQQTPY